MSGRISDARPVPGRLARATALNHTRHPSACRLLCRSAMSTTDRPAAMPAQPTPTLNHQPGAALGAARRCLEHRADGAGNEHLALAATIPIDGDPLATQLVRELVRGFH